MKFEIYVPVADSETVINWCKKCLAGSWNHIGSIAIIDRQFVSLWEFELESDLMLFKLRWA